jgi:lipoprotein
MKGSNLIIIVLITSLFFLFSCSKTSVESDEQMEKPNLQKEEFKAEIISGNVASKNPLIRADFIEGLVKNGQKTKVLGIYAIVSVSNEEFRNLTLDNYAEFCKIFAGNGKYKWVSIITPSKEGVIFANGGNLGSHAMLNDDGSTGKVFDDWILIYDAKMEKVVKQ